MKSRRSKAETTFRLWVGDLRAIFYVDKNEERATILKIDCRESVYQLI